MAEVDHRTETVVAEPILFRAGFDPTAHAHVRVRMLIGHLVHLMSPLVAMPDVSSPQSHCLEEIGHIGIVNNADGFSDSLFLG